MELADVLVLLDRFDGSAADRLELEADGWKLRLRERCGQGRRGCDRACARGGRKGLEREKGRLVRTEQRC